jgi:hypothetical protein
MIADTWNRLDQEFREFPMMRASELPTAEEIDLASKHLGVAFSADYRDFLARYGGAMVGPYPIFGLRRAEVMGKSHWSVVEVTLKFRASEPQLPTTWIVFSQDHAGNPIAMDTAGTIWIHDHDFGGLAKLGPSFEQYIRTRCLKLES